MTSQHANVVVVGAGIVGLAHAYLAAKNGKSVVVFERRARAVGGSARGFGLIAPISQSAGAGYQMATASRELWMELLQAARDGIASLNARYPGDRFLLFHRGRVWSGSELCWIGRERKRGKIEDLNAFLSGEGSAEIVNVGSLPLPIRYVITLDADLQNPPEEIAKMIEAEIDFWSRFDSRVLEWTKELRASGVRTMRPSSCAMSVWSAARRNDIITSARGQSQPVVSAILKKTTRTTVSR